VISILNGFLFSSIHISNLVRDKYTDWICLAELEVVAMMAQLCGDEQEIKGKLAAWILLAQLEPSCMA